MPSDQLTDLAKLASSYALRGPAPVHLWDPPFCGDLDIVIKRDGSWFHEGRPIRRRELVKLFSSILKKEDDVKQTLKQEIEKAQQETFQKMKKVDGELYIEDDE